MSSKPLPPVAGWVGAGRAGLALLDAGLSMPVSPPLARLPSIFISFATISTLVRFTWNYYLQHPEFLTLVNSENLHRAKHLKTSEVIRTVSGKLMQMVMHILERGVTKGVFREGIDPVQLNITIAAIGYFYLTNRFTGSIVYERDLMAPEHLEARLKFNLDTVLRLVKKDP